MGGRDELEGVAERGVDPDVGERLERRGRDRDVLFLAPAGTGTEKGAGRWGEWKDDHRVEFRLRG